MITPRSTRLIRTADLQAFQRAILASIPADPALVRDTLVIVPTGSAGEELRRTIGRQAPELPAIVTRDEFYERLRERLPGVPAPLTPFDREVLLRRAAHAASLSGAEPPFNLRPGLVREILALYDELRRRHRTVADFARVMTTELESSAGHDRGAARLLAQTRFLIAAFEEFERAGASDRVDEHQIRALAIASAHPLYRRVVVTVADQAADARGLWSADFDLLARMPFLESIDVIATEGVLEAGLYHRLHDRELPGIEDVKFDVAGSPLPVLLTPDGDTASLAFVCRDREEELAEFARTVKGRGTADLARTAIVFQRPLPYLYLARHVFDDAALPYQALDSLPLAGEPYAGVIDIVFAAIAAGFTRGALIELLRCPHFTFEADGHALTPEDVHALDRMLVQKKYLGPASALDDASRFGTSPAVRCASAAARELTAASEATRAPAQIDGILAFVRAHERLPEPSDAWYERHRRARTAVLGALEALTRAHAAHDPAPLSIGELSGAVRRWIEAQTFTPRLGGDGIVLLDASAAPYADLDELRLVGLTESDWPARAARSIFYPQSLLAQLGWAGDQERLAAARAQFQDLLRLPRRRVSLSTITLEDDAIVSPSPLLEDVESAGLPVERAVAPAAPAAFTHEALWSEPAIASAAVSGDAGDWLALRASRPPDEERYHGSTGRREPAVYAVSRLERYLECPFKYFAAHVLRLDEERDEEAWMTPQERGQFVHQVFESFFDEWQRRGQGAITTANVGDAMALFDEVAERHLADLPPGDRALERTLLLGSAAAAGFGERAFAFEIEDDVPVVERLLEYELKGTFAFDTPEGTRRVQLRSKSDRIDLLADGTLRVIDYKLGRAPDRKKALQLPIYGLCAQQALDGHGGRTWTVAQAGYIAFKEKAPFSELHPLDKALTDGRDRLLSTIDGIESGKFPVEPDEPFFCAWCAYAGVCRKDYVGDE